MYACTTHVEANPADMAVINNVLDKLEVPSCNCLRCRSAVSDETGDVVQGQSLPASIGAIGDQLDQMRSVITSLQASRHVVLSSLCCMIIMSCLIGCVFNSI